MKCVYVYSLFGMEKEMNSPTKTYLYITMFTVFTLMFSFIYNITSVKILCYSVAANVLNLYVIVPAVIGAFIFSYSVFYWPLVFIAAGIDAYALHYYTPDSSFYDMAVIFLSFILIVFSLNLIKIIFK